MSKRLRECLNNPYNFCNVCGEFIKNNHAHTFAPAVQLHYLNYFGISPNITEPWTPKSLCDLCYIILTNWAAGGRVLLFPPVNNFRRFLIHQTCENFREKYDLFTFSVGQGPFRRTVICFKSQLIDPKRYTDTAATVNFETRVRHNNSQIKNWRTDKRESEPIYFSNNNTISSLPITTSIKRDRKMGVEKNLIDAKLNKSSSLDLYRPPALRNHGIETTTKRAVCNVTDEFEVHPTATATASSSVTATATTTSISCNNSPIHRKEATRNTTDTATSTHQNSLHSTQQQQQPQQHQEVDDEQQKQPQSLCRQQQARRERRPDRAVYIPRARRSQTTPPTTTQIQQPPPILAQVSTPTANGTTAMTTSAATTNNYTSKSLIQQLAITSDDTTAASVNEKPSADEVGKTNCISNNTTANHSTKKREKLNKETRERREQRVSKKSLSIQLNHNSKNNAKSNENTNRINSDEFSSQTVIVIAQETALPPPVPVPVLKTSETDVNSVYCVEKLNLKEFDCDRDGEVILNKFESSEVNRNESRVITNYLNFNPNVNCVINEFETQQLLTEPIDTVSNNFNFTSTYNTLTQTTSDIITMPKLSNKTKSNKISSAMDTTKMPNLRIEDVASQPTKCDIEEQELQRASKEINRSNRRIMKQTFVSDILQIPDHIFEDERESKSAATKAKKATPSVELTIDSNTEEDEEEDDWENLYDESGECLDPKIIQELTASVGKCKIELPKMDYSAFLTKQSILNEEEYPHVLEVSNFPVEFKNQDLLMVFSQYKESGFDIKWVDDTHALAVFSSSRIAAEVLTMGHPFVVLKPLAEATIESRLKAKKCAASLQPYRPRPETCAALARRLVTGALGVRLKTAAAERENEKRVLREAKERKLLAAKQRDEAWES